MEPTLHLQGVSKMYGNQVAVADLDIDVQPGEIFGFLGPSGSGKTTTIKMITNQLEATDGEVRVFGRSLPVRATSEFYRRFGVLTDNSGLYQRLSIEENLALYAKLYDVPRQRIQDVLELVNLQDARRRSVAKLSKGMRQRTVLARTLLHEPELLVLDEPTSALDPGNVQHIHQGLRALNEHGTTIFLSTHDMQEAETLCDRVAFIYDGRLQQVDTPKNLRRRYSEGMIQVELTNGDVHTLANTPAYAKQLYEYMADERVAAIHSQEPTLGDIFVRLTGRELV
ncbi:ABC transporter ATP-binding protein [Marinococcus sp. PL1-022]|uniref:ABC transporter ATP-binding protein n=1 Tax=Marinococcus sp. PL1-022 TaxID=3095363 RepID=UPI0029C575C0|nr:ABC transporter ATP-binding protein [Marinococcus sp. PL1-022]MDX6152569.1 ABC transporter ATP-binding protein [Marinococcus sp. PL1-022]